MLTARHDELGVGGDEDASSEAADMRTWEGGGCGSHASQLAGPRVSDQLGIPGTARAKNVCNTTFYGYFHVLLVKINSVIYICYIKYGEMR